MVQNLPPEVQEFIHNVRFVDFLDIGLITVFLYLVLKWLRQSVSNRSILGLTILIGVYAFARATDMYLTERLIQGLFAVILIGIVVVFQTDIRRVIDRIGNWGFFDTRQYPASSEAADIITETVSAMAENKTGALMVLKGNEALERHIHGGIKLDGEISIPLLHSIFNPKSPGHDGAVVIEGSTITRFGTHLPLSVNLEKDSPGGTRHAAALGMAEHCDALVIVVSEERGTISVARAGRLMEIRSGQSLKKILTEFWEKHYQIPDSSWLDWWKERDLGIALTSIFLAAGLWFSFAYQPTPIYRSFAVPIEYRNLQENNIVLQDSIPMEARVTLTGNEQAFRSFDANELAITFDMSSENLTTGELMITQNNLDLPAGLSLYDVSPQMLEVEIQQFIPVELPVHVPLSGELSEGLSLDTLSWEPQQVTLLADTSGGLPDSLAVETLDLSGISETDTISLPLEIPPGMKLPNTNNQEISVIIEVQQQEEEQQE